MLFKSSAFAPLKTRIPTVIVALTFSIVWSFILGKDLCWDELNYHIYAAKDLLENRLSKDFMGGSWVGYQNGLPYLPFYWMVEHHAPALVVGTVLAAIHSLNFILIYEISKTLFGAATRFPVTTTLTATILAALCPIFLIEVGSSYADITTTIPVLAGVCLLLRASQVRWLTGQVLLAGVLFGAAAGLKNTNLIYVFGGPLLISIWPTTLSAKVKIIAAFYSASIIGVALTGGYWALLLWREFHNPLFPLYNGFFHSPDFPDFSYRHFRFLGKTALGYIDLPFRMAIPKDDIYTEIAAPDIRPLAFLLLFIAWVAYGFLQKKQPIQSYFDIRSQMGGGGIITYCFFSYFLWLTTSSNGRYFLPLGALLGIAIVASATAVIKNFRTLFYLVSTVVFLQVVSDIYGCQYRWNPNNWKGEWFNVELPDTLVAKSWLYTSIDSQSNSFLSLYLNKDSAYLNDMWMPLDLDGPGGKRIRTLLEKYKGRIRSLMQIRLLNESGQPLHDPLQYIDPVVARLGLRVDSSDCVYINTSDYYGQLTITQGSQTNKTFTTPQTTLPIFLSCLLVEDSNARNRYLDHISQYSLIFDRFEEKCPKLFSPKSPTTIQQFGDLVMRAYLNSDVQLWITAKGKIRYKDYFEGDPVLVGSVDRPIEALNNLNCDLGHIPPLQDIVGAEKN